MTFDHERFYKFLRDKSADGYKFFISEYYMPEDFKKIGIYKHSKAAMSKKKGELLKKIDYITEENLYTK